MKKKIIINSVKEMFADQKKFKAKFGMVEFLIFETRQKIILAVTNKDDKELYRLIELLKEQKKAIVEFPN
jgi:hypothetical protein